MTVLCTPGFTKNTTCESREHLQDHRRKDLTRKTKRGRYLNSKVFISNGIIIWGLKGEKNNLYVFESSRLRARIKKPAGAERTDKI